MTEQRESPGEPEVPAPRGGRVTLREDVRAAWLDAGLGVLVTAGVFALLYARIRSGASDTVSVMPFMKDAGTFWMYFLSQAFGWSALLWAWGTVILGLLLSGPGVRRTPRSQRALERLHRTTSLSTIALITAHALLFAAELVRDKAELGWASRFWEAFWETFVPGGYTSGTGQIAIPVGQAALYLAVPLGLLFYVRHRIGPRTWRVLHRFVIAVYVLSVWHTLLYGTNVWYDGWPRTTLWLLQLPIAALFLLRLARPLRRTEQLTLPAPHRRGPRRLAGWSVRWGLTVAVAATAAVLCAVVLTGHDGGRERPAAEPTATP
ncbi:ferric reductase-like transmembrane domain-containing protein [Streptomyces iconiensis]|uniref:Ferric reductase-like transmembrane domain-containing protein n=2 Tax=Streptomyces iconiensis TaxID=1384038 RepID=A0ABT7A886_9ACTN|nr:ferric reductase-like transmembrane domain-containing protein [Streptomyces iconiensis]MDJ1137051.1 ferric reductase-like transmembrane domain-containing protein [Streptomyces iconiensis]